MSITDIRKEIINATNTLLNGDPSPIEDLSLAIVVNNAISIILTADGTDQLTDELVDLLGDVIHIGNIVYNNIALPPDKVFIDDGTYDILLELYKSCGRTIQVGAEPIVFKNIPQPKVRNKNAVNVVSWGYDTNNLDFPEAFSFRHQRKIPGLDYKTNVVTWDGYESGKKVRTIPHENPSLVGTLDKCKFVLSAHARTVGVEDDPRVKILERDFFGKHILEGILDPSRIFSICCELKYDGVSVVVTIKDGYVVSAISRGDTGMDKAIDYTPIFYGYKFPNYGSNLDGCDVKCEAVMTYDDLYRFNMMRGYSYANARTAIIGLTGLNDGYKYRDLVTLVPLKVAHSTAEDNPTMFEEMLKPRTVECEFMNRVLTSKVQLMYAFNTGNYIENLSFINDFHSEAEYMRQFLNVMYDGIVVSYMDQDLIEALGRENFINKYQMAIKFPTLRAITTLMGISYTIGQNGVITPMAHYKPVEFLGTIHTKSSISSAKRFNENQFKIGNKIEVEYRNDVMPYVSTPEHLKISNLSNPNPILEFPTICPACGSQLVFSDKSATCVNIDCPGRTRARMANMMDKLGFKGFAEATIEKLQVKSLSELLDLDSKRGFVTKALNSEIIADSLIDSIAYFKNTKIYDYILIGSLGFTNIAIGTWKLILNNFTIEEIMYMFSLEEDCATLQYNLLQIKGIGPAVVDTIINEMDIYINDISTLLKLNIKIDTKGMAQKKIRFSGVRDAELADQLRSMGYDASEGSVTKDTDVLLIPYQGFSSTKTKKASSNTKIVPIEDFKKDISKYLQ